jgi:hypothetical protein
VHVVFDHRKIFVSSQHHCSIFYAGFVLKWTPFVSSWDDLSTLWISPVFSVSPNMSQNDLVPPFTAAATTQVKLCRYNEEEPHI